MTARTLWTIAWRDLGRNRRRTILSLVAVAMGLALLIVMNGLVIGVVQDSLRNAIRLETGHVQIRAASYVPEKLSLRGPDLLANPEQEVARASALPQVKAAAPVLWAGGVLTTKDETTSLRVMGIDPESPVFAPFREALAAGEFVAADDRGGIVMGRQLADNLGLGVGQKVRLTIINGDGQPVDGDFTIRGLFATGIPNYDQGALIMPLSRAQAFSGAGNRASAVVVVLNNDDAAPAVAAALAGPGYVTPTWRELNELVVVGIQSAMSFYVVLDAIVMLVVAVVIANSLLMTVFERIREMGILAALGLKGRQIIQMLLYEAGFLGLTGVALGIIIGLIGVGILSVWGIPIGSSASAVQGIAISTSMYARFSASSIIGLSVWTLVIIVLAALYPAWFAARLEPADALHRT